MSIRNGVAILVCIAYHLHSIFLCESNASVYVNNVSFNKYGEVSIELIPDEVGAYIESVRVRTPESLKPFSIQKFRENKDKKLSIGIMIDSHGANRNADIKRSGNTALKLINSSKNISSCKVWEYANELTEVLSLSASPNGSLKSIPLRGRADELSELFKCTIDALDILNRADAERKLLWIIGSGRADVIGTSKQDIIEQSIELGIPLLSTLVYRNPKSYEAHERLKHLSESTYGLFSISDLSKPLASDIFINDFLWFMNRGSEVEFLCDELGEQRALELAVKVSGQTHYIEVNLNQWGLDFNKQPVVVEESFPVREREVFDYSEKSVSKEKAVESEIEVDVSGQTQEDESTGIQQTKEQGKTKSTPLSRPVKIEEEKPGLESPEILQSTPEQSEQTPYYLYLSIGGVLLILTFIVIKLRFKPTPNSEVKSNAPREVIRTAERRVYGWLIVLGGTEEKIPLDQKHFGIGRDENNEWSIPNKTISSFHAEIHLLQDGSVFLKDLDSLNGTRVDDELVDTKVLVGGENISFGKLHTRFELH